MKWSYCDTCDEDFRVITPGLESIIFCPFCGDNIEEEKDEEDEDEE